jgi:uncharacterized membrane protein YkvA (DUF1232 family)
VSIKEKMKVLKIKSAQVYIAMKSSKTPWYAKIVAAITVAYALSPVDLIPDFIPVLGYLDDLIFLPIMVWITMKMISQEVWDSFEEEAKEVWKEGKPHKWYLAIPIITLWLCLIGLIVWIVIKS